MSDDYTTANVPGRLIMEKDAEITRLRAALDAERHRGGIITQAAQEVTNALRAENERLRRLVERIVEHHDHDESEVSGWAQWEALVKDARAALEGVTEKSGAGNE